MLISCKISTLNYNMGFSLVGRWDGLLLIVPRLIISAWNSSQDKVGDKDGVTKIKRLVQNSKASQSKRKLCLGSLQGQVCKIM